MNSYDADKVEPVTLRIINIFYRQNQAGGQSCPILQLLEFLDSDAAKEKSHLRRTRLRQCLRESGQTPRNVLYSCRRSLQRPETSVQLYRLMGILMGQIWGYLEKMLEIPVMPIYRVSTIIVDLSKK
jgi:hypothetical protein